MDLNNPALKKEAAQHIYDWEYRNTSSFFNMLITLIAKADMRNKARLFRAFPYEVMAHNEWMESPTPEEFYESYDLG